MNNCTMMERNAVTKIFPQIVFVLKISNTFTEMKLYDTLKEITIPDSFDRKTILGVLISAHSNYSEIIYALILHHSIVSKAGIKTTQASRTTEMKRIPYKGKPTLGKKKEDSASNILYDFDDFPIELRDIIAAYIYYITSL